MYYLVPYISIKNVNNIIYIESSINENYIKITDSELQSEFYKLKENGCCKTIDTPLLNCLHEQKFLLTKCELESNLASIKHLMDERLILTLMPTESCNFRCPYCYESHNTITMNQEIIEKIKNYIQLHVSEFSNISIIWFGGEPTLCADMIFNFSEFIKILQSRQTFQYNASMTTNGYLLTKELFIKFYEHGITSYQITLDGWNHDQTRPLVSGKGTLNVILKNLQDISSLDQAQYHFHITIRHNILKGDTDFTWYDYLYQYFGKDGRFSVLIRPIGDWGGETVKKLDLLSLSERDHLVLQHINYLKKIGMNCSNGGKGIFSKICYASFPHSMVFRANGKIEKCTVALNHPKNLIGFVDTDKGVCIDENANQLWCQPNLLSKCYSCSKILSCFNMQCPKNQLIDGYLSSICTDEYDKIY